MEKGEGVKEESGAEEKDIFADGGMRKMQKRKDF